MKVIRLVEAEAQAEPQLIGPDGQPWRPNNSNNDEPEDVRAKEYTDVDVNQVRAEFEDDKKRKDDIKGNRAINTLTNLFRKVGKYGNANNVENLVSIISGYKFKFIRYFLECLKYENLGDRNNLTLAALCTDGAKNLLGTRNEKLFTQLYNITSKSKDLRLDANYINDNNSVIYNRDLYQLAADSDDIENIVIFDKENPEQRENLKRDLKTGNIGQYSPEEAKYSKAMLNADKAFAAMSTDQKIKWIINTFNLSGNNARQKAVDMLHQMGINA